MTINSYKKLIVWEKSMQLVIEIYNLTKSFPSDEKFGLSPQIKRAAVSIPSNIAEGRSRGSKKEFVQFLRIAYASGAELETQVEIAKRLRFGSQDIFTTIDNLLEEVMKMLNVMIRKLKAVKL